MYTSIDLPSLRGITSRGVDNVVRIRKLIMAGKTNSKKSVVIKSTSNTLSVIDDGKRTRESQIAELALSPIVANGSTASMFAKGTFGEIDLTAAVAFLREKVDEVGAGNLSGMEATLTAQVTTLNLIFNEMARRAALNIGQHLGAVETYLRLAFKAQAQCRATVETLAEVKYPKSAMFIKQANIAHQQQVNNGSNVEQQLPRTGKNTDARNELMGASHGERLDIRATSKASGGNKHMEALGAFDRPKE